jgi:hypothetical protein
MKKHRETILEGEITPVPEGLPIDILHVSDFHFPAGGWEVAGQKRWRV